MRRFVLLALLLLTTPLVTLAQEAPLLTSVTAPSVERPPAPPSYLQESTSVTGPTFGMDLMVGQLTGVRPSMTVLNLEWSTVLVEGFYGGMFSKFDASETLGAGVRWMMTRPGVDSVTFGPGVDVMFSLNKGKAVYLAPTIDVSWQHKFGERAAFLLGINVGIGVGLSGREQDRHGDTVSGRVTPLISLFTGFRF